MALLTANESTAHRILSPLCLPFHHPRESELDAVATSNSQENRGIRESEKERVEGARNEASCPQDAPSVGGEGRGRNATVHCSNWISRYPNGDHYGFTLCGLRVGDPPQWKITEEEYYADAIGASDRVTEDLPDVTCPRCLEAMR